MDHADASGAAQGLKQRAGVVAVVVRVKEDMLEPDRTLVCNPLDEVGALVLHRRHHGGRAGRRDRAHQVEVGLLQGRPWVPIGDQLVQFRAEHLMGGIERHWAAASQRGHVLPKRVPKRPAGSLPR